MSRFSKFSVFLSIVSIFIFIGCGGRNYSLIQTVNQLRGELPEERFTFLALNNEGLLVSPQDVINLGKKLALHRESINNDDSREDKSQKIVVMSFGWRTKLGETLDYIDVVKKYGGWVKKERGFDIGDGNHFFIFISWDSSTEVFQRGFADLFSFIQPLKLIVWPLDRVIFPFTFWGKAHLADLLGYVVVPLILEESLIQSFENNDDWENGKRKLTLDKIKQNPEYQNIEYYFVGHSFGGRMLSRLFYKGAYCGQNIPVFAFNDRISGAVLIQPAVAGYIESKLNKIALPCPIYVTRSRHDYALRRLFPLGTFLFNPEIPAITFPSSRAKAIAEGKEFEKTIATNAGVILTPLGTILWDIAGIISGNSKDFISDPHGYIFNTLAQIPVIEVVITPINKIRENTSPPYGDYRKGLFNFSFLINALGDTGRYADTSISPSPLFSLGELLPAGNNYDKDHTIGKLTMNAIHILDYSDSIAHTKIFNMGNFNLNTWYVRLIGWLSPQGAHGDYKNDDVFELLYTVLNNQDMDSIIRERGTPATKRKYEAIVSTTAN